MTSFNWAHEDEIDLTVNVEWSGPVTHDMLFYGLADSDKSAYLYAIVGLFEDEWWSYYIGMVYEQNVSIRHMNKDHTKRLERLQNKFPETVWHLTLGTPAVEGKRITKKLIKEVEGLLIYSHWHEKCINELKVNYFFADRYISIINSGFSDPFYTKVGYGVFIAE